MDKYSHEIKALEFCKSALKADFDGGIVAKIERVERNVVRVSVEKPNLRGIKTYAVCPDGEMPCEGRDRLSKKGFSNPPFESVKEGDSDIRLGFDGNTLVIKKRPFSLSIEKNGVEVYSDRKTQCYDFYGELGGKTCHYVARKDGDMHFGLGDKGGAVDKTGRRFRISCIDAMGYDGDTTDVLYHHVPFYITKSGDFWYGIFYDTHADSVIDLGNELDNYHGLYKYFATDDDTLVYYLITGDIKEIVATISKITGGSGMMPKFSFDYSGSTMAFTDAENSQELLDGFLTDCKEKRFSCRSFYLSSGYTSIGNQRCVFNWNREKFPDVKALTKRFNEEKTYFIANVKPCFLTTHPLYNELAKKGYFLYYKDGSPALCQFWDGLGSYIDFTNPEAADFWTSKVKEQLIDNGILYTWNDNNEYEVWDKDVFCHNFGHEERAYLLKPVFSYLMLTASLRAQNKNGKARQFMSVRSSGLGASRYAATWTGDNKTDFSTLRANHKAAMGMSLSGIFNFGHDIGGFSGKMPERELLLRWLQNGVFTPRFTVHSWNENGVATLPWTYPDKEDAVRELFRQRYALLPYIYNACMRSVTQNVPIIAPMFYWFDDESISVEADDFMVGESLLAVNIFDEGVIEREVYLPKSCAWYLSEKRFEGGKKVVVKNTPDERAAYFIKEGSVMPFNDTENYSFDEKPFDVEFKVFAKDEGTFSYEYFDDDGESVFGENLKKISMEIKCGEKEVTVRYSSDDEKPIKLTLVDGKGRKLRVEKAV